MIEEKRKKCKCYQKLVVIKLLHPKKQTRKPNWTLWQMQFLYTIDDFQYCMIRWDICLVLVDMPICEGGFNPKSRGRRQRCFQLPSGLTTNQSTGNYVKSEVKAREEQFWQVAATICHHAWHFYGHWGWHSHSLHSGNFTFLLTSLSFHLVLILLFVGCWLKL